MNEIELLKKFVEEKSNSYIKLIRKKGGGYFLSDGIFEDIRVWTYEISVYDKVYKEIIKRLERLRNETRTKEELLEYLNSEGIDYSIVYDNVEIYFLKRKAVTIKCKNHGLKIKNTDGVIKNIPICIHYYFNLVIYKKLRELIGKVDFNRYFTYNRIQAIIIKRNCDNYFKVVFDNAFIISFKNDYIIDTTELKNFSEVEKYFLQWAIQEL